MKNGVSTNSRETAKCKFINKMKSMRFTCIHIMYRSPKTKWTRKFFYRF